LLNRMNALEVRFWDLFKCGWSTYRRLHLHVNSRR
jgi:hypothetical protein